MARRPLRLKPMPTPITARLVDQDEINTALFRACDTFRGAMNSASYKEFILVMLFLKYASDSWDEHAAEYRRKYPDDEERVSRMLARERFVLPPESNFRYLYEKRSADDIGQLINIALEKFEDANRSKLENVFRGVNFNSEPILGQTKERNRRLKLLLDAPWFCDHATKAFGVAPAAFVPLLLDQMVRGDAAYWRNGRLVATAEHSIPANGWARSPTAPAAWPPTAQAAAALD